VALEEGSPETNFKCPRLSKLRLYLGVTGPVCRFYSFASARAAVGAFPRAIFMTNLSIITKLLWKSATRRPVLKVG
jgi:hypothetical protein